MIDIAFNVVIFFVLLYWAFMLFTKKNGGGAQMEEKYTQESLKTYSIISGVASLLAAAFEAFLTLNTLGIINILAEYKDTWVETALRFGPLVFILIVAGVAMVFLKKKDGYVDNKSASNKSNKDDEEDF